jgi:hypothetical protein
VKLAQESLLEGTKRALDDALAAEGEGESQSLGDN